MTAVDGPTSCGGMEYPMMTCIGGQWDTLSFYEVITHEIGHMWFPMMVGSDEKRFAWMDEGLTQFDQSQAHGRLLQGLRRRGPEPEELPRPGGDRRRGRADAPRRPLPQLQRVRRGELLQAGDACWWRCAACWGGRPSTRRSPSTAGGGSTSTRRRTTSSTPSRMSRAGTSPGSGEPGSSRPGSWIRRSTP